MATDPGKPSTWIPFKPELCQTCWASCCHDMPVEVSVPDLVRLGVLSEEEASLSLSKAAKRLKNEGVVQVYKPSSFIFILKQQANGDCVFLDENRRCKVYDRRPEICRQFPKIGPRPNHCPYREKANAT